MSRTYSLRLFICLLFIGTTAKMQAQIVGANCYLKGNFVEVGINTCGAYGSNTAPPAGYHPTESGLGFVADSDEDGWDVSFPPYCGDYFVPGSPVEGWGVQIGASTKYNTDQFCSPFNIPGAITDYSYTGGIYTGVWEGDIAASNLHITQYTTLPENALYFVTRTLFCNNGLTPIDDVWYMRNVDPDNDQPWSGDFTTDNTVVYNPPLDPDALVTSEGLTYGCFLGIGAKDPEARVAYGNFSTTDGTPEQVWNGLVGYSLTGEEVGDIANSIAFYIGTIEPGECKCVAFAYILNADDLDEALEATATVNVYANGEAVPADGTVYLCIGDTLELSVLGADDYSWSWTSTGGEFIGIDTGTLVNVFTTEDIDITATGVGGFCGDAVRDIHVIVDPGPTANAGPDQAICIGSPTTLTGTGGVTYQWSPSTGLTDPDIANPGANPDATTTYTLTVYNEHGCIDMDQMTLTVNPLPDVNAGPDADLCPEGVITLNATGAVDYTWSPSTELSCDDCPDPDCTVNTTTTYTVTGTDANGCVNTDEVEVSVFSTLDIIVTATPPTIDVYLGETCQLEATGAVTYTWTPSTGLSDPNISNPIAQPGDTMTYFVLGVDANGCTDIDTITVNVIGELVIGIPTAFSPDGNGLNDNWAPQYSGSGFLDSYIIYNRWGEVVYEGTAGTPGWNGEVDGKAQPMATYTVIIKAHTSLGEERFLTGNFVLVR
ncbi:MAG: gliding motility-associated C-terminal domain-containing protein [Chitinophagales bacterium]